MEKELIQNLPRIAVGILCYGNRGEYISEIVKGAFSVGASSVILFENSCSDKYKLKNREVRDSIDNVNIFTSDINLGSAGGFGRLIDHFKNLFDENYLVLLDDDSVLSGQSLPEVLGDKECFAVFRPDRKSMRDAVRGVPWEYRTPPAGSVLALDLIYYARKALFKPKLSENGKGQLVEAPYSGLVLSRKVVDGMQGPRSDYFLYADDIEYTRRISKKYGPIYIIDCVKITEFENSWNSGSGSNNFFLKILRSNISVSTYYSIRNRIALDINESKAAGLFSQVRFFINYAITLFVVSCCFWKKNSSLLFRAFSDGRSGKLGVLDV